MIYAWRYTGRQVAFPRICTRVSEVKTFDTVSTMLKAIGWQKFLPNAGSEEEAQKIYLSFGEAYKGCMIALRVNYVDRQRVCRTAEGGTLLGPSPWMVEGLTQWWVLDGPARRVPPGMG